MKPLPKTRPQLILPFPGIVFGIWLITYLSIIYFALAFSDQHLATSGLFVKWDQGWYESIAMHGYSLTNGQSNVAFFPLYPLLAGALAKVLGIKITLAGVVVSLASFAVALQILYRLTERLLGSDIAKIAVMLLAFFPFSFFFGLVYSEALFLLLVVGVLWLCQRHQWLAAAVTAGLASAARPIGVVVALVVVIELLRAADSAIGWRHWVAAGVYGLIGCSGLGAYMLYLQLRFHDALAFVHVQRYWPGRGSGLAGLQANKQLVHLGQAFSNPYALLGIETVALLAAVALCLYCCRVINLAWGLFGLASLLIPVVTGSTVSINRYVIIVVPAFVAAAHLLRRFNYLPALVAYSGALQGVFFGIFITTAVFIG